MKKFYISLLCCLFMLSVCAESMPVLKYKNIENKEKISYDSEADIWSKKINKNIRNYYIKTKGFGDFYDYTDSDKNFVFSTNCEYEFIYNNRFIGYSNRDMKFYDITLKNGKAEKTELSKEEIEAIFPDYKVISISEFSPISNSLKVKKDKNNLKIILLNDTNNFFDYFTFSSGNAKFEKYNLRSFLTVSKPGMIQFSNSEEHNEHLWFIILVR